MNDATMELSLALDDAVPIRTTESWHAPVTLTIPSGAFVTIVTTPTIASSLFRMTLGLDRAMGRLRVLGVEPHRLPRRELRAFRRRIGSSLLPDGLMANITLRTNLMVPLIYGDGMARDDAYERAGETLSRFGLSAWADLRPSDLPPDSRQVAALARAVVARPELLLLHDPLTSLSNSEALRLLVMCREFATTVIAAVHGEDEAVCELADVSATWDDAGYRELVRAS